jgi:hypothetical protein
MLPLCYACNQGRIAPVLAVPLRAKTLVLGTTPALLALRLQLEPSSRHDLLGNSLPHQIHQFQHWWDLLHGALLWYIWLHRNAVLFLTSDAPAIQVALACKVWTQMRTYI